MYLSGSLKNYEKKGTGLTTQVLFFVYYISTVTAGD